MSNKEEVKLHISPYIVKSTQKPPITWENKIKTTQVSKLCNKSIKLIV